ncbi:CD63 antigen-like [Daphnia pulex]|uniref:CD63 antigen-like n=1 Tax=Daphnia pulex TaxID=6669 RepID=UPI001EDFAC83|nr:CD63 antigen-like [Daphnia pulex]
MGLDCCCKFLKFIVFLINILISFVGIAVVALAAMVFVNIAEVDPTKDDEYTMFFKICVVVIAMGSLLTIVGFIGCCGAAFENQCLLGTFVFLMIGALALDVAAAILVNNINKDTIKLEMEKIVKDMFSKLTEKAAQEQANIFQSVFNCCGSESANDWKKAANLEIPASCCKNSTITCKDASSKSSNDLFKENCVSATKNWITEVMKNSPMVLAIVGIIESFALITSLGLCCSIRKAGY